MLLRLHSAFPFWQVEIDHKIIQSSAHITVRWSLSSVSCALVSSCPGFNSDPVKVAVNLYLCKCCCVLSCCPLKSGTHVTIAQSDNLIRLIIDIWRELTTSCRLAGYLVMSWLTSLDINCLLATRCFIATGVMMMCPRFGDTTSLHSSYEGWESQKKVIFV